MSRRKTRGSDSRRFRDWITRAYTDIRAARMLSEDEACYLACAFHCQQCIEKAIKGFLLMETGNLYDGHNLTWLCKKACAYDGAFTEFLDESVFLNSFYISTRYPTDVPFFLTRSQIEKAVAMATDMYNFILDTIFDEDDEDKTPRVPSQKQKP